MIRRDFLKGGVVALGGVLVPFLKSVTAMAAQSVLVRPSSLFDAVCVPCTSLSNFYIGSSPTGVMASYVWEDTFAYRRLSMTNWADGNYLDVPVQSNKLDTETICGRLLLRAAADQPVLTGFDAVNGFMKAAHAHFLTTRPTCVTSDIALTYCRDWLVAIDNARAVRNMGISDAKTLVSPYVIDQVSGVVRYGYAVLDGSAVVAGTMKKGRLFTGRDIVADLGYSHGTTPGAIEWWVAK